MSWDFHGFSERFVMKHGLEHTIFLNVRSSVCFKMSWDFHGSSERFVMKHGLEHTFFLNVRSSKWIGVIY